MKKAFIERVFAEQIVDTKAYRYVSKMAYTADKRERIILRLPLESLDTTDALDQWEEFYREEV